MVQMCCTPLGWKVGFKHPRAAFSSSWWRLCCRCVSYATCPGWHGPVSSVCCVKLPWWSSWSSAWWVVSIASAARSTKASCLQLRSAGASEGPRSTLWISQSLCWLEACPQHFWHITMRPSSIISYGFAPLRPFSGLLLGDICWHCYCMPQVWWWVISPLARIARGTSCTTTPREILGPRSAAWWSCWPPAAASPCASLVYEVPPWPYSAGTPRVSPGFRWIYFCCQW